MGIVTGCFAFGLKFDRLMLGFCWLIDWFSDWLIDEWPPYEQCYYWANDSVSSIKHASHSPQAQPSGTLPADTRSRLSSVQITFSCSRVAVWWLCSCSSRRSAIGDSTLTHQWSRQWTQACPPQSTTQLWMRRLSITLLSCDLTGLIVTCITFRLMNGSLF
jgi:hypothetical protein